MWVIYLILHSPVGIYSPSLMSALLHHLCETVGDGQGGVDETLDTALQTRLCPVVQLRAWTVHTLVPADVSESVDLEMTENLIKMNKLYNIFIFFENYENIIGYNLKATL